MIKKIFLLTLLLVALFVAYLFYEDYTRQSNLQLKPIKNLQFTYLKPSVKQSITQNLQVFNFNGSPCNVKLSVYGSAKIEKLDVEGEFISNLNGDYNKCLEKSIKILVDILADSDQKLKLIDLLKEILFNIKGSNYSAEREFLDKSVIVKLSSKQITIIIQ